MAADNKLRVGATLNFDGYFEETKNIAIPVNYKNSDAVDLSDATSITMKTKRVNAPSSSATTYTMTDPVLTGIGGDDNNKILLDLTSFIRKRVNYEIKVVKPSLVFIIDGFIDITDRL